VLWFLAVVAFPAAAGIAIVRHRLFDVDLLINRTLVYGALTTCVVALYAFFVGALSLLFQSSGSPVISLVATGLLAVLFQPLRERLQRGVDRLLYGAREDPYAIISRLGQQLHETSADLQRARERLVTAREEERRRLRRDLHDGVGPTLASLAQRLDLASALVPREPASAVALLDDLKARVKATVGEIRRLAHGLRPPALDELGLVASLRELAADHNQPGRLQIVVDAPDVIPPLPAAVEVAAYRIAAEALTNVARHAQAQRCLVRLAVDGALRLEVLDDGRGLAAACRPGVGLRSMRERAAELGGTCLVEPRPEGGTRVLAHLPLAGLSPFHGKEAAG
jgi:signal transduction histidine kinase